MTPYMWAVTADIVLDHQALLRSAVLYKEAADSALALSQGSVRSHAECAADLLSCHTSLNASMSQAAGLHDDLSVLRANVRLTKRRNTTIIISLSAVLLLEAATIGYLLSR